MFGLPSSVKIYLATQPADMRKGFNGLSQLVEEQKLSIYDGHLYVFISKRKDKVKILFWDRGGFVLWYKRLEQGTLHIPPVDEDLGTVHLDAGQLGMLLEGVDLTRVRRVKVWEPPNRISVGDRP